eukprot:CAMPEP_0172917026 /NCGR_PEP_ID=MMETSP1075-20121228/197496_1 /TAXON_ID=2916 /ORGANISM="Ceratium fusus, Strain PA161109" /LENGTH=87 /DNA_ID=CAMNT_0013776427 /DNA_START=168 /DNA_END=428 /DNA_ORIENTATION=-
MKYMFSTLWFQWPSSMSTKKNRRASLSCCTSCSSARPQHRGAGGGGTAWPLVLDRFWVPALGDAFGLAAARLPMCGSVEQIPKKRVV